MTSNLRLRLFEVGQTVHATRVDGFYFWSEQMNETMSDEEFFERFEDGTLDSRLFNHSAHVKMAWIYLGKYDLAEALRNFSGTLKNFAGVNNSPALQHETFTFAYLALIHERMKRFDAARSWVDFVLTNPDIFDWKESILKKYYRDETLKSNFAKKYFVFPDKFGQPTESKAD